MSLKYHNLSAGFITFLIYLSASHYSNAQLSFNWAHSIGSNINQHTAIYGSDMSMNNSMVVTGMADTSVDFDPGSGVYKLNYIAAGSYIAKFDTAGNFIYARSVPDTAWGIYPDVSVWKVTCDSYGNAYVLLYFDAYYVSAGQYAVIGIKKGGITVFDSLPRGKFRNLILKYDVNGNCTSVKKMATGVDLSDAIIDHHNNLIITGYFGEYLENITKDLQPGPGVSLFSSIGPDAFITKMNSEGHLTFIKVLHYVYTGPYNGVIAEIYPHSLAIDSKDNIFFSAGINGLYDVDPGPDTNLVHAAYASKNENGNGIFEKLDSSGNFVYRKKFFNTKFGMGLKTDVNDNVILYGFLGAPIDIDPSNNNTVIITPTNSYGNMLIAKFNNNGKYLHSKLISGNDQDYFFDFHITKNNKFFLFASAKDSSTFASIGIPSIGQCNASGKRVVVQIDSLFNGFYYDEISNSYDSSAYYSRILSDIENNIYLCGSYTGRFDADFSPAVYYLENPGVNPIYHIQSMIISKYVPPLNLRGGLANEINPGFIFDRNNAKSENDSIDFSIAANSSSPSTVFSVQNMIKKSGYILCVFNSTGQLVIQNTVNLNREKIQLNLNSGLYVFQICFNNVVLTTGKLIAY